MDPQQTVTPAYGTTAASCDPTLPDVVGGVVLRSISRRHRPGPSEWDAAPRPPEDGA